MQLSEHFSLAELTVSPEAVRNGINNTPSDAEIDCLRRLCAEILEPLRAALGKPIIITSGFRCLDVNSLIGGARTSDHMFGRAADIHVKGMTPLQVCQKIVELNLPYKQVIHEFGTWTHCAIPLGGVPPKREKLTAKKLGGKTVYVPGLE